MHVNAWLLVNWRRANETHIRCGWTIPGHIGSAVLRNKFKRWGREYLKKWSALSTLAEGLDMNMILKRRPDGFYRELTHKDFDEAMSRATAKLR